MDTYDTFAMVLASLVSGYWAMKVLVRPEDRVFDVNTVYGAATMTSGMMVLYMAMMGHWMAAGIALIFASLLWYLWKNQVLVTREQFLRSMANHHSMALSMAQPQLDKGETDPRVAALEKGIIDSQEREIALMKALLAETPSTRLSRQQVVEMAPQLAQYFPEK